MTFSFQNSPQLKEPNRFNFPKRHPVLFPIAVFIIILLFIGIIQVSNRNPIIGVVLVEGVILDSEPVINKLLKLDKNPQVKGIILRINCPGGAVSPSQEIFTELIRLKQSIKIYSSIASVATSGCYYIATGTEKIYANPGSVTGSIGVIMQSFNAKELMKKIGLSSEVIKAGENKDMGSIFRDMSARERKLLQSVLNDTHRQFINDVALGRNLDSKKIEKLADGRIFTGRQALDLGLIDDLASFRQIIDLMKRDLGIADEIELYYPTEKKFFGTDFDLQTFLSLKEPFLSPGLYYLRQFF
ncbi:MAG: signal peptide peptidase SppA [Deltaproteobacteria bacterium]|nr:signal peptide peptidase SppA [Deltaproteobacteria bacterium]